jgi:hypothetical protein
MLISSQQHVVEALDLANLLHYREYACMPATKPVFVALYKDKWWESLTRWSCHVGMRCTPGSGGLAMRIGEARLKGKGNSSRGESSKEKNTSNPHLIRPLMDEAVSFPPLKLSLVGCPHLHPHSTIGQPPVLPCLHGAFLRRQWSAAGGPALWAEVPAVVSLLLSWWVLVFLNFSINDTLVAWVQESPGYTYVLRMNPQAHGYTIVALHLRSIQKGIESNDERYLALGLAAV